jgi:hypothetical protein
MTMWLYAFKDRKGQKAYSNPVCSIKKTSGIY